MLGNISPNQKSLGADGKEERRPRCHLKRVVASCAVLFLVLLAGLSATPYSVQNPKEDNRLRMHYSGDLLFGEQEASPISACDVNITVNCGDVQGVIPPLYVGHYDVDPTRTGIGLYDTTGTKLMKDIDLGFWRVSIGRWEMMDFPSNEDIQKREYFRGSTFEDASNASMYCWEHMEEVFSSVSQFNCIPLVCIDYMPRTLANNTEEMPLPRLYTYPNNVRNSPPKNTTVFAEVIKHVVMHCTQGWPGGTGHYYNFEYWEVWNEPELAMFWNGTLDNLFQMYGKISKSIKSIDTSANPLNYKVGGLSFAVPGTLGVAWNITDFLSYCKTNGLPLDFLSWHGYPYDHGNLIEAAQISRNELLKFGYGNALNILAEWGIPLGIGEHYWNSSYYAAFTSLILADLEGSKLVDFQTHTCMKDRDVVNSSGSYWGILRREPTTAKPAYYVFRAFDMMNETCNQLNYTLSFVRKRCGQAFLAGASSDRSSTTLIYTNFNDTQVDVEIEILGLLSSRASCVHYLIDNETSLAPIGTAQLSRNGSAGGFSLSFVASPYTIHIFRITVEKPDETLPLLSTFMIVAIATILIFLTITIRRKRARVGRR